jgi:hypothetical protein
MQVQVSVWVLCLFPSKVCIRCFVVDEAVITKLL